MQLNRHKNIPMGCLLTGANKFRGVKNPSHPHPWIVLQTIITVCRSTTGSCAKNNCHNRNHPIPSSFSLTNQQRIEERESFNNNSLIISITFCRKFKWQITITVQDCHDKGDHFHHATEIVRKTSRLRFAE